MAVAGKNISSTTYYTPDSTMEELGKGLVDSLILSPTVTVEKDANGYIAFTVIVKENND